LKTAKEDSLICRTNLEYWRASSGMSINREMYLRAS